MAQLEVRDRVIWTKHIHGQPALVRHLEGLSAGETIRLRVDGVSGLWKKMKDRPSGAGTPGLTPIGEIKAHWRVLFNERRGQLVEVSLEKQESSGSADASSVERDAAWLAFAALTKAGWRSEEPYGLRDELHER